MSNIIIYHPTKKEIIENNLEKELLWYDIEKKEMKKYYGGKLFFKYKFDEELNKYRMMPETEEIKIKTKKINVDKDKIKKWFITYSNYNDTNAEVVGETEEGIIFNVPDDEIDNFSYNLERNGIEYEI